MSVQKGTASTRLLGMKFMQRAAAADNQTSAPPTPDGRPAKRMRLSNGTGSPSTPALSDQQRLQAAQAEESLQRSAVMAKIAAEAGETHWVLNVKEPQLQNAPLNIIQAGFADLDSAGDESAESGEEQDDNDHGFVPGRMVFGQLKKYQPPPQAKKEDESSSGPDSSDDSSDESENEEDNYKDIRATYAAKKENKAFQEQQRMAAIRRKKEINLNKNKQPKKEPDVAEVKHISHGKAKQFQGDSFRPGADNFTRIQRRI